MLKRFLNGYVVSAGLMALAALLLPLFAPLSLYPGIAPPFVERLQLWRPDVREAWLARTETNAWQRLLQVPAALSVVNVVAPEHILVGTADDRLFESRDDGRTWTEVLLPVEQPEPDSAARIALPTDANSQRVQNTPLEVQQTGAKSRPFINNRGTLGEQKSSSLPPQQQQQQQQQREDNEGSDNRISSNNPGFRGIWIQGDSVLAAPAAGGLYQRGIGANSQWARIGNVAVSDLHVATKDVIWVLTDNKLLLRRDLNTNMWRTVAEAVDAIDGHDENLYFSQQGRVTHVSPRYTDGELLFETEYRPSLKATELGLWWFNEEDPDGIYRYERGGSENVVQFRLNEILPEPLPGIPGNTEDFNSFLWVHNTSGPPNLLIDNLLVDTGTQSVVLDTGGLWNQALRVGSQLFLAGQGLVRSDTVLKTNRRQLGGLTSDLLQLSDRKTIATGSPALVTDDGGQNWSHYRPEHSGILWKDTFGESEVELAPSRLLEQQHPEANIAIPVLKPPAYVIYQNSDAWIIESRSKELTKDEEYYDLQPTNRQNKDLIRLDESRYFVLTNTDAFVIRPTRLLDDPVQFEVSGDTLAIAVDRDKTLWYLDSYGRVFTVPDLNSSKNEVGEITIEPPDDELLRMRWVSNSLFLFSLESPWLIRSNDGGMSWEMLNTNNITNDIAAGANGALLRAGPNRLIETSFDNGSTWQLPAKRTEGLPPLTWLLLILAAAVLLAQRFAQVETIETEGSQIPQGESDAPTTSIESDTLNRRATVFSLLEVIRNPGTEFPLTLAITGDWGSGKSSIMGMLKGELEKDGFLTVWFNAWHHSDDNNLLTALLDGIVREALPTWWHLQGFIIHARLLIKRASQHPTLLILLGLLILFAAGLHWSGHSMGKLARSVPNAVELSVFNTELDNPKLSRENFCGHPREAQWSQWIAQRLSQTQVAWTCANMSNPNEPLNSAERATAKDAIVNGLQRIDGHLSAALAENFSVWYALSLGAAGGFALLISLINRLSLGLTFFQGLARGRRRFLTQGQETDPGLRYRISKNLEEICQVLPGERPLVVFIDDIDRCSPAQQLEVLQVINFLTESADKKVLVVVGCSIAVTLPSIASYFDETVRVNHLAEQEGDVSENEIAMKKREYADYYLRKIFNMEQPCDESFTNSDSRQSPVQARRWVRWVDRLAITLPLAALLLWTIWGLGTWLVTEPTVSEKISIEAAQRSMQVRAQQSDNDQTEMASSTLDGRSGGDNNTEEREPEFIALPALPAAASLDYTGIAILLFLLVGLGALYAVTHRFDPSSDSEEFKHLIKALSAVLHFWSPTPRQQGRLMNQLRLIYIKAKYANASEHQALQVVLLRVLTELVRSPGQSTRLLTPQNLQDLNTALTNPAVGDAVLGWATNIFNDTGDKSAINEFTEQKIKGGSAAADAINSALAEQPELFTSAISMGSLLEALTARRFLT